MSTTIGSLDVKLNLELQRLDAQIKSANAKVAGMGRRMNSDIAKAARGINTALSTLGVGVGVGALVGFGREIIKLGSQISDLSRQANISTDAFQTLAAVGRDSGVTGEQIALSFVRLGATVQEAAEGSKAAVESLAKLNLTAAGLKALAPEEQFEVLARRIQEATDKEKAFNAGLEILGAKTAPKLREVLERLGTEGFGKLREAAKDEILTAQQLKTLDDFGDKLERIAAYLKVIGAKAGLGAISAAQGIATSPGFRNPAVLAPGIALPPAAAVRTFPQIGDPLSGRGATPGQLAGAAAAAQQDRQMAAEQQRVVDAAEAEVIERLRLEEIIKEVAAEEALRNKSMESGVAILKEQKELLEAQAEYAIRFGPDLKGIKEGDLPEALVEDALVFEGEMARIFSSVGESASRAFAGMVIDGGNALDALADMVARAMLEMVARLAIINPLLNSVFGGTKGFEVLPTLFSAFGGGKAGGGMVNPGRFYKVGEEGEELFAPSTSGRIIPNHQLNGGGYTEAVTINNYVQAGVSRAELIPALNATSEATIARIRDMDRRRK